MIKYKNHTQRTPWRDLQYLLCWIGWHRWGRPRERSEIAIGIKVRVCERHACSAYIEMRREGQPCRPEGAPPFTANTPNKISEELLRARAHVKTWEAIIEDLEARIKDRGQ